MTGSLKINTADTNQLKNALIGTSLTIIIIDIVIIKLIVCGVYLFFQVHQASVRGGGVSE